MWKSKLFNAVAILATCLGTMASCAPAHATEIYAAPPAPFVTPFVPLGDCLVPYFVAPQQVKQLSCQLASPAGLMPGRAMVIASVASGSPFVQASIVYQGEVGGASDAIVVEFTVRNTGIVISRQGEALVNIAIAQMTTPAVAAAGVK